MNPSVEAKWNTEEVRFWVSVGGGRSPAARDALLCLFDKWLAAREAEVRADEQTRILGGLLRLPITHIPAWDQGWWYSVSITDAISVVRGKQP